MTSATTATGIGATAHTRDQSRRTPRFGYVYESNGSHPAGWRFPGAEDSGAFDAEYVVGLAQRAEAAKFDFLFLGDRLATSAEYEYTDTSAVARLEPFTTAAYLATLTEQIGIVVTANSTYYEPFNLARLAASLDHITKGRASWNVVTGVDTRAAQNHSRLEHGHEDHHFDRAEEFIDLVRALWDSWEDDAFIRDKETGEFVDGSKIHHVNHDGKTFQVKGPLNVARSPQGHPVLLHAVTSERSRQFAAQEVDVVVAGHSTIAQGQQFAADIKRRASESGRHPNDILIFLELTPVVGATLNEAREIYDELNSFIVLDEDVRYGGREPSAWAVDVGVSRSWSDGVPLGCRNLGALSEHVGLDVTTQSLDAVVSPETARLLTPPGSELVSIAADRTGRTVALNLTWRDVLYTYIVGRHVVVGGPTEVADFIEAWQVAGAVDGFNIRSAFLDRQFGAFVDLVIPELRRRGLFQSTYEGSTLREHLGLARPNSRFTLDQLVEVSS